VAQYRQAELSTLDQDREAVTPVGEEAVHGSDPKGATGELLL
jgi:hypothetical protein